MKRNHSQLSIVAYVLISCSLVCACGTAHEQATLDIPKQENDTNGLQELSPSRNDELDSQADSESTQASPPANIAGASLVGECYSIQASVPNATDTYLTCMVSDGSLHNFIGVRAEIIFNSGTILTASRYGEANELVAPTVILSQEELNDIESINLVLIADNAAVTAKVLNSPVTYQEAQSHKNFAVDEIENEERLTRKVRKYRHKRGTPEETVSRSQKEQPEPKKSITHSMENSASKDERRELKAQAQGKGKKSN